MGFEEEKTTKNVVFRQSAGGSARSGQKSFQKI